jgi:hypothetical protein
MSGAAAAVIVTSCNRKQGHVEIDGDGQIWWAPGNGSERQLLADSDSMCGFGFFETGPEDPFRDCCSWHDNAYIQRKLYEEQGWDRKSIDDYFLTLMLEAAREDLALRSRAYSYHAIARCFGGIWYYRHLGKDETQIIGETS